MSTIIRRLPISNPDSVGLTPVTVTDDEYKVFSNPALQRWFRGDAGYSSSAWFCRVTNKPLVKSKTSFPTKDNKAAYNNNDAINLTSLATTMWDNGENFIPPDSFTIVSVGRAGPSETGFIWATKGADFNSLTDLNHNSTSGFIQFQMRDRGSLTRLSASNTATYPRVYADGPFISVCSYDAPTGLINLRLNRGRFIGAASAGTLNSGVPIQELHIGEAITGTSTQSGVIDGGDIGEMLIYNTSLAIAANAGALATLEAYLGNRYGITAP